MGGRIMKEKIDFYMPTKVILQEECVDRQKDLFKRLGSKVMIVTGQSSAKQNGAQRDVINALEEQKIDYIIFDQVMSNPTIACVYKGAKLARKEQVEGIIAIGGGSPMDAAKVINLLTVQDIKEEDLFSGVYEDRILPMIHIPTTAGTGSEVTPYAVLTNDSKQTKTSIGSPLLFPRVALCDAKYTMYLDAKTTIHTVVDALSHAIEGMFSVKATTFTDALALESIQCIVDCYEGMKTNALVLKEREKLLYASTIAGIVIAQTKTTTVHAMGYSLTYFKGIDHGRANALLLGEFLTYAVSRDKNKVQEILEAMNLKDVEEIKAWLDSLLGKKEKLSSEEIHQYTQIASLSKGIKNCKLVLSPNEIEELYTRALG